MRKHIVARSGLSVAAILMAAMLQQSGARADEFSQILRGYEIISEIFPRQTQLHLAGKDWALVGLGSYLVNSTGCNDCHTHPNWAENHNPYLGQPKQINTDVYLSGGRIFGPVATPIAVSANITPDPTTGWPAGLKLWEFIEVMRTGHDPRDPPNDILRIMPWPLYQWKTRQELTAMYEYLRVIPSLKDNMSPGP